MTSPVLFRAPRPSRPRWRSAGRRRSTPHPFTGRSRAEDGGGATFLPREEWAKPRGRKSNRRRCGSGDRGAAVLWPDQPRKRPWVARRTASSGEVVANLKGPAQEDWHTGRTDGGHSVEKRRHHPSSTDRRQRPSPASCRLARGKASRSGHSGIRSPVASRQAFAATISANLFDDGETKASAPLIVQPPVSRQISAPRAPPVRRRSQQCQSREGRAP